MNFGDALTLVKNGHKITRAGWNGKGMWIEIQRPDANSKMTLPYLFLNYPHGDVVPWLASQTDLLQEDWMIHVEASTDESTWSLASGISLKEFNKELQKIEQEHMVFQRKKPHWTQTAKGKKILAARKRRTKK